MPSFEYPLETITFAFGSIRSRFLTVSWPPIPPGTVRSRMTASKGLPVSMDSRYNSSPSTPSLASAVVYPSVMSLLKCRSNRRMLLPDQWEECHAADPVQSDVGGAGEGHAPADSNPRPPQQPEGAQRPDPAQVRRGAVSGPQADQPGNRRRATGQHEEDRSDQEALCGARTGGGALQTKGQADIHKKGGRGLRGASDRLELRQTAPRSRPLVVALAGRQDGGVAVHRFDFS